MMQAAGRNVCYSAGTRHEIADLLARDMELCRGPIRHHCLRSGIVRRWHNLNLQASQMLELFSQDLRFEAALCGGINPAPIGRSAALFQWAK